MRLSETIELVVRASAEDERDWLVGAPVCATLARHGISHVGVAEITAPYHVRRPDLSGTFVMVCTGGEGRVWIEGEWRPMSGGMACLAPPHAFHAYRAVPRHRWSIAWVRYQEPEGALPIVNNRAPVLTAFDGAALSSAISGLWREAGGAASSAAMHLWVDLIDHYAHTFAAPWRTEDRLREVWEGVVRDLSGDWSIRKLSAFAGLSPKQLGRLCQQSFGRTPAQHLTALRLQRAAHLLATTQDKIESIARQVGYQSVFTFSHTFKKFTGRRPSEYRNH